MANEKDKYAQRGADDIVMWLRLPRPTTVKELSEMGLKGDVCFGGDTCIAATSTDARADIIVKGDLEKLLKGSALVPRGDCFGGDTCIV